MSAVEVMPAVCDPAIPIAETFQALDMAPQVDMPQAHENQDGISSDGEHGRVLDANARVYYASSIYGTTSVYYCGGNNPPAAGWVEEHNRGIGYDAGRAYPVYGEDGSILYYTSGYGYLQHCHQPSFCPQPPGAFVSSPAPSEHAYGPQPYPLSGPIYQHSVPPGVHYYSSPSFNSKQESVKPGYRKPGTGCGSNFLIPKHGYLSPSLRGPYSRGSHIMASSNLHAQDGHAFYERARTVFSNPSDTRVPSREPVHDTAAVFQRVPASSECPQSAHQEPRASCISASIPEARPKGPPVLPKAGSNSSGRRVHGSSGVKAERIKSIGCNLPVAEGAKQQGQVNVHVNQAFEPADSLNDQAQRPRMAKCSAQKTVTQNYPNGHSESAAIDNGCLTDPVNPKQYNKEDFQTRYSEAKFFIIKSYSEDDVHKSIKYAVWSSTPNGNRRLDGAYREAQGIKQPCPVFLLFSVNTSGQFCGVAEMVGSVDYYKSMDFWLQGKWSGCFPVKWHIVKDVPNSQFRHIILANNDNKPVTHSRDTQEVKSEQGTEMLTIFKSFPLKTSILDDFSFYDDRQKFLEERKSKQRVHCQVGKTSDQRSSDNTFCEGPSLQAVKAADQTSSDNKNCESPGLQAVKASDQTSSDNKNCSSLQAVKASDQRSSDNKSYQSPSLQAVKALDQKSSDNKSYENPSLQAVKELGHMSFDIKSCESSSLQTVKELDHRSSDIKSCESPSEIARGEDKENGKPGELQEVVSNTIPSSCGSDKIPDGQTSGDIDSKLLAERSDESLSITTDKMGNSKPDCGKDDSSTRSINYKRALMENVKGMANVGGKPITV